MDGFLKQSTAITIRIGPFLDSTDGNTQETGLTISYTDVVLSKAGGAFAAKNDTTGCTHDSKGYYSCPLNATDTNTLGMLKLAVHVSGALPVWHAFMVLPANIYDSLVAGTDKLDVDTYQITAGAITSTAIADSAIAAAKIATGAITNSKFATGAIDAAAIADNAITAAKIATGAIDADALAADAVAEVADGVWDEARSGHTTAGTFGEGVASVQGNVTGSVNSVTSGVTVATNNDKTGYGLADGAITAAKIATDAITADKIAADAIGASELAAAAVAEIADAIWDESTTGHTTAGTFGAQCATDIDDILTDTSTMEPKVIGTLATGTHNPQSGDAYAIVNNVTYGNSALNTDLDTLLTRIVGTLASGTHQPQSGDAYARLGAPVGASISADLQVIDGNVDAILDDTGTSGVVVASGSKTGYSLSSAGIDAIWDALGSLNISFETLVQRIYQILNNKMIVTEATGNVALRNLADTADIATGNVQDMGATTERAALTWV